MAVPVFKIVIAVIVVIILGVLGLSAWLLLRKEKVSTPPPEPTAPPPDLPEETFAPSSLKISVFTKCDYAGTQVDLGVGNHYASSDDFPEDQISSLKVPHGLQVTLYEFDKKYGRSVVVRAGNYPCLTDFKSITSSMKVEAVTSLVRMAPMELPAYRQVAVYSPSYRPETIKQLRTPGVYTSPANFPEMSAKITIDYGFRVTATYTDGTSESSFGGYIDSQKNTQTKILKTLKVENFIPPVDDTLKVAFFAGENMTGERFDAGVGVVINISNFLTDIKSIDVPPGLQVLFYKNQAQISVSSFGLTPITYCPPVYNPNNTVQVSSVTGGMLYVVTRTCESKNINLTKLITEHNDLQILILPLETVNSFTPKTLTWNLLNV